MFRRTEHSRSGSRRSRPGAHPIDSSRYAGDTIPTPDAPQVVLRSRHRKNTHRDSDISLEINQSIKRYLPRDVPGDLVLRPLTRDSRTRVGDSATPSASRKKGHDLSFLPCNVTSGQSSDMTDRGSCLSIYRIALRSDAYG